MLMSIFNACLSLLCRSQIYFREFGIQLLLMKRHVELCIFFCLIFSIQLVGQPKNEQQAKQFTDLMQERLSLSAEQFTRVYEINLEAAKQARDASQQTSDQIILKQKFELIREQIDTSLLEILSTLQWWEWIKLDNELNGHESDI
jgi:uncharacterized tellurite resistance protein B-like protein